jgi:divalent metal cation (Fe/Co/Zn/Cd) transporter
MPEPAAPLVVVRPAPAAPPAPAAAAAAPSGLERARLVRRARRLAWLGLGWHAVEATVALAAGIAASSVALVGFGADSLVEGVAGVVVLWRFAGARAASEDAERRAQRLIGASFVLIAVYVGVEAVRGLIGGHEPDASWVGIALSVATLLTMPPLAVAKGRLGARLGSAATSGEGRQNMLCAYLSAALLAGLVANAALGWWWADPVAALAIAGVALREGRDAWRGEDCGCGVPGGADGCC